MRNDQEEKGVALNFLAGMGLGALIGAATALLLAPKSGNETRQDIMNATEDMRSKASKAVHEISQSSEELVKRSRELLESTKGRVQHAVESGRQAMQSKQEQISEEAEEV